MVLFLIFYFLFVGAVIALYIITMWKIYVKAGYQGWEAIIPIYNYIVLLKIVGKPWWWILMLLIPGVNLIFGIWAINMLSKSFGKEEGFTVGLIFLSFIFYPILAFGDAQYQGPYGDPVAFEQYRKGKQVFDFEQEKY